MHIYYEFVTDFDLGYGHIHPVSYPCKSIKMFINRRLKIITKPL
jgi:hypothetical protein